MDPFTHLLAGFLLGHFAFASGPLVAWTTFMAFLPDVDTVSWFLPGPFRRLRHRGVTHSLVFGVVASALGAVGFAFLAPGIPPWLVFAAGLLGFLSHVLLDVVNWGCLLLWPFRKEPVAYTVQQGLGGPFLASGLSGSALALAWNLGVLREAALGVALLWSAYLLAKLAMRAALARRHAPGAVVHPTAHPLRWRVVETRDDGAVRETDYYQSVFFPRLRERRVVRSRHAVGAPALPLRSREDAAAFTFRTREIQALRARALSLAVGVTEDGAGGWLARWYVLDYHRGDGCLGALVRVAPDGRYSAEKARLAFPPEEIAP